MGARQSFSTGGVSDEVWWECEAGDVETALDAATVDLPSPAADTELIVRSDSRYCRPHVAVMMSEGMHGSPPPPPPGKEQDSNRKTSIAVFDIDTFFPITLSHHQQQQHRGSAGTDSDPTPLHHQASDAVTLSLPPPIATVTSDVLFATSGPQLKVDDDAEGEGEDERAEDPQGGMKEALPMGGAYELAEHDRPAFFRWFMQRFFLDYANGRVTATRVHLSTDADLMPQQRRGTEVFKRASVHVEERPQPLHPSGTVSSEAPAASDPPDAPVAIDARRSSNRPRLSTSQCQLFLDRKASILTLQERTEASAMLLGKVESVSPGALSLPDDCTGSERLTDVLPELCVEVYTSAVRRRDTPHARLVFRTERERNRFVLAIRSLAMYHQLKADTGQLTRQTSGTKTIATSGSRTSMGG
ncbi:unnamed protein product [Vitrella brassicaformis CCMP3155]|uniref:PH domain-containing protein n=1 Tax=Vitrella brassicaformis (strain CCMP3155) TaxID=1169540 RepID=A0A0G4EHD0_VITBC|nr:unnamed protein product [Vitrella brassicaformis CCMP3155]|mmetsp:Transcript_36251/g.90504  ORF Transcript_36251/g.90504 Transcript_36251/m.90504 type:complete len:415 (-) Transcript_36251:187-1431(-)|eukprot:CEL95901.1 unnamed protein product [Vitrella brassicaformis CCMP3155]